MAQDIIPDSTANRLDFFRNLRREIDENAAALSFDTGPAAAVLDPLINVYEILIAADQAAAEAGANASQTFAQSNSALRALFNQLKANPRFTDGMGESMRIFTRSTQRDPGDITPRLKAVAEAGAVRLNGSKDYAETVNIYMRLAGTTAWTLIGAKRKKFPFEDQTPLKTPGTPEVREYLARGVIGDDEVGRPSGIISCTFAG